MIGKRNLRVALWRLLFGAVPLLGLVALPGCGIIATELIVSYVLNDSDDDDDPTTGGGGPSTAPAAITDLVAVTGSSAGSVDLTWTATGSTGTTGTASAYVMKYSTDMIFPVNFAGATEYSQSWSPVASGGAESETIYGLTPGLTYYFAVVAVNAGNEASPISNVDSAQPSAAADTIAPDAITDLTAVSGTTGGEIDLTWTAPGDDGSIGTAWSYVVKLSTSAITAANFDAATTYSQSWNPGVPGAAEAYTLTGLVTGQTYFVAVKTRDEVPNASLISNVPSTAAAGTLDVTAPGDVLDLNATPSLMWGSIDLSWTASGDDAGTGTATAYEVRYSTAGSVTDVNWTSATVYNQGWVPQASGQAESFTAAGFSQGQAYFFGIRVVDEASNPSNVSNSVSSTVMPYPAHVYPTIPIHDMRSVWGSSSTDVFAVGEFGTILHNNGSTWSDMASGTQDLLQKVWGTSSTDVFAVGVNGTILHYDGVHWGSMSSGTSNTLNGIWGSSASDVFVVGHGGTILRYDGSRWTTMPSGTWFSLYGVWGATSEDVYAVGDNDTILHYDGRSWSVMITGGSSSFRGIHGTSATDIFAVGGSNTMVHFDGTSWSILNTGISGWTRDVWAYSSSNVFAVGSQSEIYRYDGNVWSPMSVQSPGSLMGVWGSSSSDIYAVGYQGAIFHYGGSAWTKQAGRYTESTRYEDIWGTGGEIWAVGTDQSWPAPTQKGLVMYYDGSSWSTSRLGDQDTELYTVYGFGTSDVWTGGNMGASNQIYRWTGSSWNVVTGYSNWTRMADVWGGSANDLWICPDNNIIYQYNHSTLTWSQNWPGASGWILSAMWVGTPTNLKWFVGPNGTVQRYDGTTWFFDTNPTADDLEGIWGTANNDIWAVGEDEVICHWNGTAWSIVQGDTGSNNYYLYDIWGSGASDIWTTGTNGTILHYDGSTWTAPLAKKTPHSISGGVWGTGPNDVYFVTERGEVLHYP